jgi:hypothetical protein
MSSPKFDCLYLHIGKHKTGTSVLQKFFQTNEMELAKRGIIYPKLGRNPTGAHHNFFMPVNPSKPKDYAGKTLEENIKALTKLAGKGRNLLMSTESLSKLQDVSILQGLKSIASHVKVIIYLRRQDSYVESAYSQVIKDKYQGSIYEFIKGRALDYKEICDRWSEIFDKENIIVRPYEREQFKDNSIFSDFMAILGIDDISAFSMPKINSNPSLNKDAIQFKRLVNMLNIADAHKRKMQEPLVDISIRKGKGELFQNHSILSPIEKIEFLERFKESNSMVAYDYLNRNNKILFYDPLPELDADWSPYPGLDRNTVLEIADYMSIETPELFEILTSGIQEGLASKNLEIYNAAKTLKPALDLENRTISKLVKPAKIFRKILQSINKLPIKSFLEKHPNLYAMLVRVYQRLVKDY